MLRFTVPLSVALVFLLLISGPATAHFGMVIPSDNMVMQGYNTKKWNFLRVVNLLI